MRVLHCWKDRQAHIEETYGFHSDEHIATYLDDFVDGTCMLPTGHEGPHEFTPDDQIGVTFRELD
jgi:hypothetical protein